MIYWLIKNIYASVEIKDGEVIQCFHKIPQGFVIDLKDILETKGSLNGLIYVKIKQRLPHLYFKGDFDAGLKQRILNCWVVHRDKYK